MRTDGIWIFFGESRADLLSHREDGEAYAMAESDHWYAVYFPDGGSVILQLAETLGFLTMRWLSILTGGCSPATRVSGGGLLALGPPGAAEGPWAVVLIVDSGP